MCFRNIEIPKITRSLRSLANVNPMMGIEDWYDFVKIFCSVTVKREEYAWLYWHMRLASDSFGLSNNKAMKQNFEKTDRFIVVVNMDWDNQQGGKLDLTPEALDLGHIGNLRLVDQFADTPKEYLWDEKKPYLRMVKQPKKS